MRAYGAAKHYEARNENVTESVHKRTGRRIIGKATKKAQPDRHLKKRARAGELAVKEEAFDDMDAEAHEWGCDSPWCQCRFCEDWPRAQWEPFLARAS